MTVLTLPAKPGQDTALRPVPWRRMAWVTWRQHRPALTGAAVFLGLVSLYLLILGRHANHAYAQVAACHPASSADCQGLADAFSRAYWTGADGTPLTGGQMIAALLLVVPVLLGTFLGAPVLAREFETGTFRFAWTQGSGRLRWAVAKLVLLAVLVTGAAGAFTELFSWYYRAFLADGTPWQVSRLAPMAFGLLGVAFAAWTLTAFALGVFFGALIRRTVPAMAATLATWTVLAVGTAVWLRPRYQAPLKTTASPPASAWVTGHVTQWTLYQPASRFWPFQLIEGGWLLALSVLLIAATVWLVRRRAT
jgi:hypothetical protein